MSSRGKIVVELASDAAPAMHRYLVLTATGMLVVAGIISFGLSL
ncbi:hypothetical protein [Ferruginivarius sediminum]|nr:hypothetical protein [Ferruginivarius sediminum]